MLKNKILLATCLIIILLISVYFYSMYTQEYDSTNNTSSYQNTEQKPQIRSKENESFVYETEVESADDCSNYEHYNTEQKVCYFECANQSECAAIQKSINDELISWDNYTQSDTDKISENSEIPSGSTLATYNVNRDEKISLTSGENIDEYTNIWEAIAALSPDTISNNYIESYVIYANPKSDTLAFVSDDDANGKWTISINLPVYKSVDLREKKTTLVHELAHIISLNSSQITVKKSCQNLYLNEGCANNTSYIQTFWLKYWKDISNPKYDGNKYVTQYATTNVAEDFAETFASFVIGKHQTELGDTIRDQKIKSLYSYTYLIQIRDDMRNQLSRDIVRASRKIN